MVSLSHTNDQLYLGLDFDNLQFILFKSLEFYVHDTKTLVTLFILHMCISSSSFVAVDQNLDICFPFKIIWAALFSNFINSRINSAAYAEIFPGV